MPAPDSVLESAVKEIVAALRDGDWTRFSHEADGRFYDVIRESDRLSMERDRVDWNELRFQPARAQSDFEDWYIRVVLAEQVGNDDFEKARKAMRRAGIDPAEGEAIIAAAQAADSAEELRGVMSESLQRLQPRNDTDVAPLLAFLQAAGITGVKSGHIFLSGADRQALRGAFELRFLKELAERFPKVVERATDFGDWLSYYSPHLREAVRCYLYGFFSASILVAVAALDFRLNQIAHADGVVSYPVLVAKVFGVAGVVGHDPVLAKALEDLFTYRNDVAHDGAEGERDRAIEVLCLVRGTLDRIESATPSVPPA